MMTYMGLLEDKIKRETEARISLMETYENSLNKGVDVLDYETKLLGNNPLVKEISLVVAKELLSKSKDDPDAIN